MHRRIWAGALIAAVLLFSGERCALAQNKKLVLGTPGIPPIFVSVIALVADAQGFFKKSGVDVDVKGFESGDCGGAGARRRRYRLGAGAHTAGCGADIERQRRHLRLSVAGFFDRIDRSE